jgi:hypothetical protein
VLDPLLFFGNLNADGTQEPDFPSILAGANSFKYLFRINLRNPTIDPTPIESTETVDISAFDRKGNIGYLNEYLNQGTPKYSLVSFAWDNTLNEIDGNINTRGFGQIRSDSGGNFTATTDLKIGAYSVPVAFDPVLRLQPNYDWQFVYIAAAGVPNSAGNISSFSATVNGGDPTLIDFEFTVLPNAYTENYSFVLTVSNDNANANHNNIFLRSGVSQAEIPVVDSILLLKNTGSAYGEDDFHFLPWYETDKLAGGFNHVHAFRADDILALWRVQNALPADTTITEFKIEFKQRVSGAVIPGESYTINLATTTFPLEIQRNEQRADNNDKRYIRVIENTAGEDYDFEVGFQIWRLWMEDDIVLSFTVIGNQFETPFVREFQSPDMELGQYDTTRNTPVEPQGLPRDPIAIEYTALDPVTAAVVATGLDSVVSGLDTKVVAYWEDNNLNDLQVTVGELVAYLGVNIEGDAQATFRPFFSTYDAEASTPWKEVTGHTAGRVKVALPNIKTATAEAVIVWSQLVEIFGADNLATNKVCIIPRMDKIQNITFYQKEIGFHFRNGGLDQLVFQITETMSAVQINELFTALKAALVYRYGATVPSLDLAPNPYVEAAWIAALAGAVAGEYLRLDTTQTAENDPTFLIRYVPAGALGASTIETQGASKEVSVDGLFPFQNKITISGTYSNLWASVRETSTEDYTIFDHDLSAAGGVAALNLDIGLVTEGDDYQLHTWDENGLIDRTINFNYSVATNLQRVADVGEESDPKYRTKLVGTATNYDGLTNRSNVTDFIGADTATGQNLTFLASVDTTGFSQTNTNPFFSTTVNAVAKTGLSFAVFNNQPWLQVSANTGGGPNYNFIPAVSFLQKRHVMIYTLEWLNVGATVDFRCSIYLDGKLYTTDFLAKPFFELANSAANAGIMRYNSPATANQFTGGNLKKLELIKGLATPAEIREAYNAGSFEGVMPAGNFSLNPDFTGFVPGGSTGELLVDNSAAPRNIEHYGGWAGSAF